MNTWKVFADLFGGNSRIVGEIVSMNANSGKATVKVYTTAALDEQIIVSGATSVYNVGEFVFIEDKVIVSMAPPVRAATEISIQ